MRSRALLINLLITKTSTNSSVIALSCESREANGTVVWSTNMTYTDAKVSCVTIKLICNAKSLSGKQ